MSTYISIRIILVEITFITETFNMIMTINNNKIKYKCYSYSNYCKIEQKS